MKKKKPRNEGKIAEGNKQASKSRPPQLMLKEDADLITTGNMEDNLSWLPECDWVVEWFRKPGDKKSVLKI